MRISFHGEAILPDCTIPDAYVHCEDGVIVSVSSTAIEGSAVVEGRYIGPGYVDLHVHGGAGSDYMDGTVDAVLTANRATGGTAQQRSFPPPPRALGKRSSAC